MFKVGDRVAYGSMSEIYGTVVSSKRNDYCYLIQWDDHKRLNIGPYLHSAGALIRVVAPFDVFLELLK